MSLISEALKKARQEAARQDSLRQGVPYAVGTVDPPRRNPLMPLFAGLGAGCLLAGLLFGVAWIAGLGPFAKNVPETQVAQAPAVPEPSAMPGEPTLTAPEPVLSEAAPPAPAPPPVAATPVPEEQPEPAETRPVPTVEPPAVVQVTPPPAPVEERPAAPIPAPTPSLQIQPTRPAPPPERLRGAGGGKGLRGRGAGARRRLPQAERHRLLPGPARRRARRPCRGTGRSHPGLHGGRHPVEPRKAARPRHDRFRHDQVAAPCPAYR